MGYIRETNASDEEINILGRDNYRKFRPDVYNFSIGGKRITVNKVLFKETAKASVDKDSKSYFYKNEVCRNLDRYMKEANEIAPEPINNHNSPRSKAYKLKQKLSQMRVFSFEVNGVRMIMKAGVYKNSGNMIAYTCYIE